jgi:nitroimidazol reductase NimA-like FMN-containing flavoprotein (pyridoxamine 5'-phosphate oxidase superfamily)
MRRKEKEITAKAEIESIIRQSLVCRLALSDEGAAYIVPLCFGYKDNALYFHSAKVGKKLDILKRNNAVCFEFDIGAKLERSGKTPCDWGLKYRSVIGFGQAVIIEDPEAKRKALEIITAQYADGAYDFSDAALKGTAAIKVEISSMTGKQSV